MGESLPFKACVRPVTKTFHLCNATLHNLQNISVDIPLGVFGVVAGVAGSGKSSLMECFRRACPEDIVYISQKNIGVSLRSTPATYMEVAGDIRKAFAKPNKLKEEYFTFNGKGACPVCGGKGVIVSEMAFMDSIETVCEACGGLRYCPEALQYTLRGKNIAEVMDLSVRRAMEFFQGSVIEQKLKPLADVGLQYLHLNQALSTLSGGELQRLKLASFLGTEGKIFVIDEPTDGLHTKDVRHILGLFDSLVDRGNTVWLIEHNTDVIRSADYVIELGPGAGEQGGRILYCGTPAGLLTCPESVTGKYL
jgi:excinuclease UvrABC ATPase subunit